MAQDQNVASDSTSLPSADDHLPDFHVVGVGASAGGLESLERLFTHVPTDTGMAVVVLQHLSPDFKSLMDELLARRTRLPIRQAEHETRVEPDTIYLLPPMKEMIIRDRQEVSRAGGVVLCESPDTAKFNGMPLSAIATGIVDQVLAPEDLAAAIAALSRQLFGVQPDADGADAGDDLGINAILRLLRDEYAIDFSHYKASTVTRRIERRLALNRSLDIDTYVEQLQLTRGADRQADAPADSPCAAGRHAVSAGTVANLCRDAPPSPGARGR